jgi:hypothetical protein
MEHKNLSESGNIREKSIESSFGKIIKGFVGRGCA